MHNELKITDMQTLESNKKTILENPIDENSLDLPDFTTIFFLLDSSVCMSVIFSF